MFSNHYLSGKRVLAYLTRTDPYSIISFKSDDYMLDTNRMFIN